MAIPIFMEIEDRELNGIGKEERRFFCFREDGASTRLK